MPKPIEITDEMRMGLQAALLLTFYPHIPYNEIDETGWALSAKFDMVESHIDSDGEFVSLTSFAHELFMAIPNDELGL